MDTTNGYNEWIQRMEAMFLKKKSIEQWVRWLIVGALVVNLLGIGTGVIDNVTFSLILQLLAGLSLMWTAWLDYQKDRKIEGMTILYVAIGVILLGQFLFDLVA